VIWKWIWYVETEFVSLMYFGMFLSILQRHQFKYQIFPLFLNARHILKLLAKVEEKKTTQVQKNK
jgi:hypothetical protein